MTEVCRSCKAPIRWAVTVGGHPMPVDVEPVSDGNLRLEHRDGAMPRVTVIPPSIRQADELLYVAHFRSCPHADQHRKR